MAIPTIAWKDGCVKLIDQRQLPGKLKFINCRDVQQLWWAIKTLSVRGAPALGVAAAFGIMLGLKSFKGKDRQAFKLHVSKVSRYIGTSRPTAVNLFNALERMQNVFDKNPSATVDELKRRLFKEAMAIFEEDRRVCSMMGQWGQRLIKDKDAVLTICNAGALATVDY